MCHSGMAYILQNSSVPNASYHNSLYNISPETRCMSHVKMWHNLQYYLLCRKKAQSYEQFGPQCHPPQLSVEFPWNKMYMVHHMWWCGIIYNIKNIQSLLSTISHRIISSLLQKGPILCHDVAQLWTVWYPLPIILTLSVQHFAIFPVKKSQSYEQFGLQYQSLQLPVQLFTCKKNEHTIFLVNKTEQIYEQFSITCYSS